MVANNRQTERNVVQATQELAYVKLLNLSVINAKNLVNAAQYISN
jgi:hypothetical protein